MNSIYEQLALSSSAYAYCWSKWNGVEECPEDTVVMGAVEWCKDSEPTEVKPSVYFNTKSLTNPLKTLSIYHLKVPPFMSMYIVAGG